MDDLLEQYFRDTFLRGVRNGNDPNTALTDAFRDTLATTVDVLTSIYDHVYRDIDMGVYNIPVRRD